jgi:hypothetical protein
MEDKKFHINDELILNENNSICTVGSLNKYILALCLLSKIEFVRSQKNNIFYIIFNIRCIQWIIMIPVQLKLYKEGQTSVSSTSIVLKSIIKGAMKFHKMINEKLFLF